MTMANINTEGEREEQKKKLESGKQKYTQKYRHLFNHLYYILFIYYYFFFTLFISLSFLIPYLFVRICRNRQAGERTGKCVCIHASSISRLLDFQMF